MRIAGIKNYIIGQNINVKKPLNSALYNGGFSGAESAKEIDENKLINFYDARSQYIKYGVSLAKPEKMKHKTQIVIPQKYLPVVEKSKRIPLPVPCVLEQVDDICKYAKDIILKTKMDYLAANLVATYDRHLKEYDDSGSLEIKSTFDRNGRIKIIRDYKNNSAIIFDNSKKNYGTKYTVLLGCEDINNPESIEAEESFTFESGRLTRYTTSCRADINSDNFIAGEAFGFKDNKFKTYDEILSISSGTEYSKEYYEFQTRPGYLFTFDPDRCSFKRFVSNKVAVDDKIYYSSDEFLISQCERV